MLSYDLRLFRPSGGASASLERDASTACAVEHESIIDEPRPRDPEKDARRERLAAALYASVPRLDRLAFDHAAIAAVLDCTPADARLRIRYEELNDTRAGMQVTVFDDAATVTLAHETTADGGEPESRNNIRTLWRVLEVCEREAGLRAFDHQLNRVLTLEADFEAVLACYLAPSP